MAGEREHWVFGYGSLMWDPGFPHAETVPARVRGWHRAFCITSHNYRGTPERPGAVLGLDRGGSCVGRAFRVDPADWPAAAAYLDEREMVHYTYERRWVRARLEDGRTVMALTYVADRSHERYCGGAPVEHIARLIATGRGKRGSARDYLANVVAQLDALGIRDGALHALLARVEAMAAQ